MNKNRLIGILAFGSLIDNPGIEISEVEKERITCETPFKIEFARISSSRDKAPTLIPIEDNFKGKRTNAVIIVIDEKISFEEAKSILWRRECHISDKTKNFIDPISPTSKNVLIGVIEDFCGVAKVLYTRFLFQDEYKLLGSEKLSEFAIESIMADAGRKKKDGIRYLLAAKQSGIETEFSKQYEDCILRKTKTRSLQEAIEKLDNEREKYQG